MRSKLGNSAAELEATFNTAETIDSTDYFRAETWDVDFDHDKLDRNTIRDVGDKQTPLVGGAKAAVKGMFYLVGGGTAGSIESPIADILQSAGLTLTTVASMRDSFIPDADLDGLKSITACQWYGGSGGKKKIAKGVRGNLSFKFTPGAFCECSYDGQGVRSSGPSDEATPAASSDTYKPPRFVSANCYLQEIKSAPLVETEDAIDLELRDGAASNLEYAINITGDGKKVSWIGLRLKKNGTPANETNGVVLEIQGDAAGDPDGTPITGGTSAAIATSLISTTGEWHWFKFASFPTLTNAVAYHIVVTGDWDVDPDNNIMIGYDTVLEAAQICQEYDAAWAALALKNINVVVLNGTVNTLKFGEVNLDLGNSVDVGTDPNDANGYDGGQVMERQTKITVAPEDQTVANMDFQTYMTSYTDLAMIWYLGTTAGNRFQFTALHLQQIADDKMAERVGQKTYELELVMGDATDLEIRAY